MSQWLHMYSGKMNKVIGDLEKAKLFGEEHGELNLNEIINLLNGAKQELVRLESERNQLLSDSRDLKEKNKELQQEIDRFMGGFEE